MDSSRFLWFILPSSRFIGKRWSISWGPLYRNAWEEILKCEPLDGHEQTDAHDASYAIYTSGTTGNPKGVLHEYGNIEECIRSVNYEGNPIISEKDRGALLAPMNFVATIMMLFCVLYCGGCKLFIASYATIKNPLLLKKCSLKNA